MLNLMKAENDKFRLTIFVDEHPLDPRKDFDNEGKMICWHGQYELGDEHGFKTPEDFRKYMLEIWDPVTEEHPFHVLPVYLLDHSGLSISTSNFQHVDPGGWDSGQVGWIYGPNKKNLREEVILYNHYLTGQVWGFILEEIRVCPYCEREEEIFYDACSGFYGFDYSQIIEYLPEEAEELIDKLEEVPY